jgi:hypothetical protein
VQPEDDHTPAPGVLAWVTGAAAGIGVGGNDVDGGATILTSPVFDLTGMVEPHLRYYRWYVTGYTTNPSRDPWIVEISSNGGGSWVEVEHTDLPTPAWIPIDVSIGDVLPVTNQFRVRFTANDVAPGSITEAAIDDFTIYDVDFSAVTDVVAVNGVDPSSQLSRAYPNPLRSGGVARLDLSSPRSGTAVARVYDVAGRRVATLLDGAIDAGATRLVWDGRSESGRPVPAGVYFVRVQTDAAVHSRRVLLVR